MKISPFAQTDPGMGYFDVGPGYFRFMDQTSEEVGAAW
jgi:hypothetical protein